MLLISYEKISEQTANESTKTSMESKTTTKFNIELNFLGWLLHLFK